VSRSFGHAASVTEFQLETFIVAGEPWKLSEVKAIVTILLA